jgi:UDP-2-acetamido-2-deoxy-ribo-hexuluronate aminotransferase
MARRIDRHVVFIVNPPSGNRTNALLGITTNHPPLKMQFIDLQAQYKKYQPEIDARMQAVLNHGQFILGPEIAELEKILAEYVGVKHCLTIASGTDSLEIALRALDIGPGHEVITVPFTWISTAEVIGLVGAKPVFVDIEPDTYNLDAALLEKAITPRTKAIIPVNLFGQMPDYRRINAIAAKHNIPVIEDAAQSFGAAQNGRRSCAMSLIGSTSFFPAKPLGCYGDGGALFTSDDLLADKMRAIRTHGGVKRHEHSLLGMNGRFDTLQAAVLLAKFPHFDAEVEARARIGARYSSLLSALCAVPSIAPGNSHVYAQYTVRVPRRDAVGAKMKEAGIPTAVYYPMCLHEQPIFAGGGYKWGDFPVSEKASREVLSLPMHPFLSESDQDKVVAAFKKTLAGLGAEG